MLGTMPPKAGMSPEQFRDLLKAAKLTQVEAAKRLGYSFRAVNRWCNGKATITVATATLIREKIPHPGK